MDATPSPFFRPINDPIALNCRLLINQLEKRIEKDFGLKAMIAYEKECRLVPATESGEAKPEDFKNAVVQSSRQARDKLGNSASAPINRFYVENSYQQFEIATMPATASQAVARINGQCQLMEHAAATGKAISHDGKSYVIKKLDFTPFHNDTHLPVTAGLHLNISLQECDTDANVLTKGSHRLSYQQKKGFVQHLRRYLCKDTLLIAPSDAAYKRFAARPDIIADSAPENIVSGLEDNKFLNFVPALQQARPLRDDEVEQSPAESARFAFNSPSADARHDLATLMLLTAIYCGLRDEKLHHEQDHAEPATSYDMACNRFRESSGLIKDLRSILPGEGRETAIKLQTAICEAAKKHELAQPSLSSLTALAR